MMASKTLSLKVGVRILLIEDAAAEARSEPIVVRRKRRLVVEVDLQPFGAPKWGTPSRSLSRTLRYESSKIARRAE